MYAHRVRRFSLLFFLSHFWAWVWAVNVLCHGTNWTERTEKRPKVQRTHIYSWTELGWIVAHFHHRWIFARMTHQRMDCMCGAFAPKLQDSINPYAIWLGKPCFHFLDWAPSVSAQMYGIYFHRISISRALTWGAFLSPSSVCVFHQNQLVWSMCSYVSSWRRLDTFFVC